MHHGKRWPQAWSVRTTAEQLCESCDHLQPSDWSKWSCLSWSVKQSEACFSLLSQTTTPSTLRPQGMLGKTPKYCVCVLVKLRKFGRSKKLCVFFSVSLTHTHTHTHTHTYSFCSFIIKAFKEQDAFIVNDWQEMPDVYQWINSCHQTHLHQEVLLLRCHGDVNVCCDRSTGPRGSKQHLHIRTWPSSETQPSVSWQEVTVTMETESNAVMSEQTIWLQTNCDSKQSADQQTGHSSQGRSTTNNQLDYWSICWFMMERSEQFNPEEIQTQETDQRSIKQTGFNLQIRFQNSWKVCLLFWKFQHWTAAHYQYFFSL